MSDAPVIKFCPYCGGAILVKPRQSHKYRYFCPTPECEAIEIVTKRVKGLGVVFYATKKTTEETNEE